MSRLENLKDAIEGECEGLAITDQQAKAILDYVDDANCPCGGTRSAHAAGCRQSMAERLKRAAETLRLLGGDHYCETEPCTEAIETIRRLRDRLEVSKKSLQTSDTPDEARRGDLTSRGIDGDIVTLIRIARPDADARLKNAIHCRVLDALAAREHS